MKIKGKITTMLKMAREWDRYYNKTGVVPQIIELTEKQFSEYYSLIREPMPETLFFRGIKVICK